MATLGGTDLGSVWKETPSKDGNIDVFTMPLTDSTGALIFDYNGALRTITINGTLVATTTATLITNYAALEAKISGDQSATIKYAGFLISSASVKVNSISGSYAIEESGLLAVDYTIVMTEGTDG